MLAQSVASLLAQKRIDQVVGGLYRIVRSLGTGGMGMVYEARRESDQERVAIKLLHPHLADDSVCFERFQREAEAAASVHHPHVVEVFDTGVDRQGHGPIPYLVMEYVEGPSIADVLLADGGFELSRACRIVSEVLVGLEAVHAQGVVHRDLKPDNVLLAASDDSAKIFDFGVAVFVESERELKPSRAQLTPTGTAMGTPHYCSPEQLAGSGGRDPRVDVYAAGLLLYEMIAGSRPFVDDDLVRLCQRIMGEEPPPLRVFRKDVPEVLENAILDALNKEPEQRPESAAALRARIEEARAELATSHK